MSAIGGTRCARRIKNYTIIVNLNEYIIVHACNYIGTLQLSLPGFDHIPSNGAVLISDVGTIEDGRALICRHNATDTRPAGVLDEWYYMYGTEQEQRVEDHDSDLGWRRNRDEDNGIYVVRLGSIVSMAAVGTSQEGVYSCVVPTTDTDFDHVEVGLYYSSKEIRRYMYNYSRLIKTIIVTIFTPSLLI